MSESVEKRNDNFVEEIKIIIGQTRAKAVRSVEFHRVEMYWKLGERIFEEEQQGQNRADYGSYLIRNLSKELEPEFGSGFTVRQLERCRQFYRIFPIASALRSQLNWSQYKMLISIEDSSEREYYELEAVKNAWTGRELERQINSNLYERLLLSNDKEAVLAVARKERLPETPSEIVKDPMILEFLGLERKVNYFDRYERMPDENPTIGILLCASKNNEMVKLALPEHNKTILANQYKLYLPTEQQLLNEIKLNTDLR